MSKRYFEVRVIVKCINFKWQVVGRRSDFSGFPFVNRNSLMKESLFNATGILMTCLVAYILTVGIDFNHVKKVKTASIFDIM